MLTQAPKGTKDIFGYDMNVFQETESIIKKIVKQFGIEEIRTPIFEHTELFLRGVGDTTDIVQKEMYTFIDKGERSITLRPEMTAGVARAFIEHGLHNTPQPTKLFYIAPMFRYENTQAGRQRQFHQFGVELYGSYSPALDAEAISVAYELIKSLGIESVELKINSLGDSQCRNNYNTQLKDYIGKNLDGLCTECKERFEKNPLRILDCKEERCKSTMENAPLVIDCLGEECKNHFETLQKILDSMGIQYTVDPLIVRGLDYYTKTVFEFITNTIGAQGTVCGGGRYDNLVEQCGGNKTGGVGFGLGMERLIMTLEAQNGKKEYKPLRHIYLGSIGDKGFITAQGITYKLRKNGIIAECDTVGRSVKAQMKYANKIGAMFSAILGDNEVDENKVSVKNMETGEITNLELNKIEDFLIQTLNRG